jgi:hypothetical protein
LPRFVEAVVAAVERARQAPADTEAHLRRQVEFVNEHYTWKRRAAELIPLLSALPPADLLRSAESSGGSDQVRILSRSPSGAPIITFGRTPK